MKAVLLVSGSLGLECLKSFPSEWEVVMVFTDRGSKAIIDFASERNIPVFAGNPRKGKASEYIRLLEPEVVFSINYLFLVEEDIINWPSRYCFNIHGSLLPRYRGRTPHVWAIINGEKITGATVHLVDKGCDTGDIVLQKDFEINDTDTGAIVLEKFRHLYPEMIKEVLDMVRKGEVRPQIQDHNLATRFGVRTPESGRINWSWHRERIMNWVRAQAKPYPMAFTFAGQQRVCINKVKFSPHGFDCDDPDGLVLSLHNRNPIVKTPNGALELLEYEGETPAPGTILS